MTQKAEGSKPKLVWSRATADHMGTCQLCQEPTNRIITFRPPGHPRVDAVFICDDCLQGIRSVPTRTPSNDIEGNTDE